MESPEKMHNSVRRTKPEQNEFDFGYHLTWLNRNIFWWLQILSFWKDFLSGLLCYRGTFVIFFRIWIDSSPKKRHKLNISPPTFFPKYTIEISKLIIIFFLTKILCLKTVVVIFFLFLIYLLRWYSLDGGWGRQPFKFKYWTEIGRGTFKQRYNCWSWRFTTAV